MTVVSENKDRITDMQQKFIDALFENGGNRREAMYSAGYSKGSNLHGVLTPRVVEAIVERASAELASGTPKAVMKLLGVLDDPTKPGTRDIIQAVREIMDRAGLAKVEKVQHDVSSSNALFILPPKDKTND